ncbi:MAG TPA: IscS subfamily cysteine desulfurase [Ignavibacteria bacterium]|nr:IscS subfamily cysteine desulfurase [Ignavibacteria bacterium]HRB01365.1 IscS subfamily cysteine desulfurase [Ignavibacteria bacterium]
MKFPVYMDYNATTPVDPEVLEEMIPYFCEHFGNASSANHKFGWNAEEAVSKARKNIADLINASPREIIFTAGSTEANNISLKGVAEIYEGKGNHIITCTSEHKAILETCEYLETRGFEVTYLKVDKDGLIDLDELKNAITDKTILVSIMAANNEIGTIQPVEEIGKICRENGVLFHTDATQAVGKIPVDVQKMNIDLMSISAHKFYGPKGVGALYVRSKEPRVNFTKQMHGGSQEKGLRGGTLNVPGIVGMGKACEISMKNMNNEMSKHIVFRDRIIDALLNINDVYLNGHRTNRLTNNINFSIGKINIESLLGDLKDIALSTGSACTSSSMAPSHVLSAIGREDDLARSSIRISFGRFTTEEEIDYLIEKLTSNILKLREEAPEFQIAK